MYQKFNEAHPHADSQVPKQKETSFLPKIKGTDNQFTSKIIAKPAMQIKKSYNYNINGGNNASSNNNHQSAAKHQPYEQLGRVMGGHSHAATPGFGLIENMSGIGNVVVLEPNTEQVYASKQYKQLEQELEKLQQSFSNQMGLLQQVKNMLKVEKEKGMLENKVLKQTQLPIQVQPLVELENLLKQEQNEQARMMHELGYQEQEEDAYRDGIADEEDDESAEEYLVGGYQNQAGGQSPQLGAYYYAANQYQLQLDSSQVSFSNKNK